MYNPGCVSGDYHMVGTNTIYLLNNHILTTANEEVSKKEK